MKPSFLDKNTKPKSRSKSASKTNKKSNQPNRSRISKSKKQCRAKTTELNTPQTPPQKSSPGLISYITKFTITTLILLIGGGILLYVKRDQWGITAFFQNHLSIEANHKPKPDPARYSTLIDELTTKRTLLKARYLSAATREEQQQIITEASTLLEDSLPAMMRCWLGHPYDFHGTASTPGEGKIACGYYVSIIMRDAGFKIDRFAVAQQASQNIIRTFVDHKDFFEVKTNTPYPQYIDDITKRYEGINIVGLDTHVAFIVIKDGKMRYIHSSGGAPQCVVDEGIDNSTSLQQSNYRVISNISRNRNVIKKWILDKPFITGGNRSAHR